MSGAGCRDIIANTAAMDAPRAVRRLDPRTDPWWAEFVQRHPQASVFHSPEWLESLARTYGYTPFAWTTSPEGTPLQSGLVFCSVNSWLTGRRLVSLPFSDHCEPLIHEAEDLPAFAKALENEVQAGGWRYVEIRPLNGFPLWTSLHHMTVPYHFHQLDLEPDLGTLFRKFHKDSIQRKIRRAERERLYYEEGSTDALLDQFYTIFRATRARHSVPPPPRRWFRNLMDCFGQAMKIRVACKEAQPVAAMITIRHKDTLIYKYGGSDSRFTRFGGVHLLYWQSIQDAKNAGLRYFDLGRTDADQDGLVTFKNRWGATHATFHYFRYASAENATHLFDLSAGNWKSRLAKAALSHVHPRVLAIIGNVMYKHVG